MPIIELKLNRSAYCVVRKFSYALRTTHYVLRSTSHGASPDAQPLPSARY